MTRVGSALVSLCFCCACASGAKSPGEAAAGTGGELVAAGQGGGGAVGGVSSGAGSGGVAGGSGGAGGGVVGGAGGSSQGGSSTGGKSSVVDLSLCDAPMPCEPVTQTSGDVSILPGDAQLRCLVQAFHDGTPGIYVELFNSSNSSGMSTLTTVYLIKADGTVDRMSKTADATLNPAVCALRPPADYDACLNSTPSSSGASLECISVNPATSCVAGPVSCD